LVSAVIAAGCARPGIFLVAIFLVAIFLVAGDFPVEGFAQEMLGFFAKRRRGYP
jgi:hypothetical protein